ncbi:MAG: hypothetical protein ACKPEN_23850 [Planktothrix sp.]|uniref:hypothetical protein n=1 Tax=Planktothrix sp. TaxID=3088171 RepID=UPI0038D4076F
MLPEKLTRRQLLFGLSTVPMAMANKINRIQPRETVCNPKFNIGDYVECKFEEPNSSAYYERGEIISIVLQQNGKWDYTFVIRECPESFLIGAHGIGYENELTLLARANSKTELFGF